MYALIAMAIALGCLILMMHFKIRLGRAMVAAALVLTLLLRVTPTDYGRALLHEWQHKPLQQTTGYLWITLTALVAFVNVLGIAMKEAGISKRLAPALQRIFKSRRLALGGIPAIMGLLPTPGGIMLSAPMVRDLGDSLGVERSRQAAINFLFRHQWESVWPIFPSVPLIQTMFGMSALSLMAHNSVLSLTGLLSGTVFLLFTALPRSTVKENVTGHYVVHLRNFLQALGPIALVAGLYAGLGLPPACGMLLAILAVLLFHRVPVNRWAGIFRAGLDWNFALLIFGAMLFKLTIEAGQAVDSVVQFFHTIGAPPLVVIFVLPFTVACLTGVTVATVAMTFPFLTPFIGTGAECRPGLEALAFAGVLCGLFVTPVHLCLALSTGYFSCSFNKLIRYMVLPVLFIAGAGIVMALI